MKIYLLLTAILFSISACDTIDDRLTIVNGSNDTIYYAISNYKDLRTFYDEEQINGIKFTYRNYVRKLGRGGERREIRMGSRTAWEDFIEDVCDDRKIHLYVFDKEILEKYDWKDVTHNGYVKSSFEYSLDQIKENNWRIIVP